MPLIMFPTCYMGHTRTAGHAKLWNLFNQLLNKLQTKYCICDESGTYTCSLGNNFHFLSNPPSICSAVGLGEQIFIQSLHFGPRFCLHFSLHFCRMWLKSSFWVQSCWSRVSAELLCLSVSQMSNSYSRLWSGLCWCGLELSATLPSSTHLGAQHLQYQPE